MPVHEPDHADVTRSYAGQRGFSLIEALVAMLVLSIGLLGLAGLQAGSLRNNQDAYQRSQATLLAESMFDVLRANRRNAENGDYDIALDDDAATGDPTSIANIRGNWLNRLATALPGGDGVVSVDTGTRIATVTVQWANRREPDSPHKMTWRTQL